MEDVEIINLLWQREEMGLLELERKYRAYCNAIAMNILQSAEDAEECVSDTWMKIWNSIPPGIIEVICSANYEKSCIQPLS